MNEELKHQSLQDVSLIIATYNEEESLGHVLDELKQFELGEIIIVDGNSTDNTKLLQISMMLNYVLQSKRMEVQLKRDKLGKSPLITYMDGDGSYNQKLSKK